MPLYFIKYSLHFIDITTIINTKLVAMLSTTASVAQLVERRSRFARLRVRFPAGLPKVAFFATGSDTQKVPFIRNNNLNVWNSVPSSALIRKLNINQ